MGWRRRGQCPQPSATDDPSVHQVAYRHQLEARMAVVRGNTLESGYTLLVPHTTALAQAEPVTVHAAAGPTRTTGESSLLRISRLALSLASVMGRRWPMAGTL